MGERVEPEADPVVQLGILRVPSVPKTLIDPLAIQQETSMVMKGPDGTIRYSPRTSVTCTFRHWRMLTFCVPQVKGLRKCPSNPEHKH